MTTLICWAGVHAHGTASIYLASDSRISWGEERTWDVGRKLFAARLRPDIFGYFGDVVSPSLILGQIVEAIDFGYLDPFNNNFDNRSDAVFALIRKSISERVLVPRCDFGIIYVTRFSENTDAFFRIYEIKYDANSNNCNIRELKVPTIKSQLVQAWGSGAAKFVARVKQAVDHAQSGTSRSIFWHLCDSLETGADSKSGGSPQIVGLYRSFPAKTFGVVLNGSRFLNGLHLAGPLNSDAVEWRDKDFQRVNDETMRRLAGAQPHGRNKP